VNDYGLGDVIAKATEAFGVKPCGRCKRRAEALNEIGRRGLIKGSILALFMMKESVLRAAWQAAGGDTTLHPHYVIGFVRQFGTFATTMAFNQETESFGAFPSLDEIFKRFIEHKEHFKPGTLAYEWMSRLNFFTPNEPLPGWRLDYATIAPNGFRFTLSSKKYTFALDEDAIIYEAVTPDVLPRAKDLRSAAEFPGATECTQFKHEESRRWL